MSKLLSRQRSANLKKTYDSSLSTFWITVFDETQHSASAALSILSRLGNMWLFSCFLTKGLSQDKIWGHNEC